MSGILLPLLVSVLYLAILSALSELVERRATLRRLAEHPVAFGLALGVFATSWSFYGSLGYADGFGYGFLAVYVGAALSCVAIPAVWRPLASVVQRHRLSSVADLLAFRYQSQAVGVVITLFLLAALLPYLSLQLRAIADGAAHLATPDPPAWLGLVYAGLLSMFAAGLGVRYAEPRRTRPGLVATLAIESLVKLLALVVVGGVAVVIVFGGWSGLVEVMDRPEVRHHMFAPLRTGPWASLVLAAFAAMFLLPRQFHVAFVERGSDQALRHVAWVVPLLLLLLNLPVPVLYWAGREVVSTGTAADLYVLGVAEHVGLPLLAFIGGISASSAMVLVSCIALSGMVVNHVVLPLRGARAVSYERLVGLRRLVIAGLVAAGFGVHTVLPREEFLVDLGLVSFVAVLQLVPGVVGTLVWPRATRRGLAWGLAGGILAWFMVTVMPLLAHRPAFDGLAAAVRAAGDPRSAAVWVSLGANALMFVIGSLWRPPSADELAAAEACRPRRRSSPLERLPALGLEQLRERLGAVLGPRSAEQELQRALDELGLPVHERRPAELRRLALAVQRNVAELVGPLAAAVLVGRGSAEDGSDLAAVMAELRFLDERAASARSIVDAPERSFQLARRYLSRVLDDLPLGVCSVDRRGEIAVWNHELATTTGIAADRALGTPLDQLPAPWGALLAGFLAHDEPQLEHTLPAAGPPRIVRLRRPALPSGEDDPGLGGEVIVVEDLTERRALRAQAAHQDRLASVGRLAAGVAHELRNPLTGVIMVARNLCREPHADDAVERLGLIVSESQRIEEIVRTLLTFSGPELQQRSADRFTEVDLEELVGDAIRLVGLGHRRQGPKWTVDIEPGLRVRADAPRLIQVLVNLLSNARDASPPGGLVAVRGTPCHGERGGKRGTERGAQEENAEEGGAPGVMFEVEDRGSGIPAELAHRIFEPFVTTKAPGRGTGLGLAVAYRIVQDHGGSLTWRPARPHGTVFRVQLPRPVQQGEQGEQEDE